MRLFNLTARPPRRQPEVSVDFAALGLRGDGLLALVGVPQLACCCCKAGVWQQRPIGCFCIQISTTVLSACSSRWVVYACVMMACSSCCIVDQCIAYKQFLQKVSRSWATSNACSSHSCSVWCFNSCMSCKGARAP